MPFSDIVKSMYDYKTIKLGFRRSSLSSAHLLHTKREKARLPSSAATSSLAAPSTAGHTKDQKTTSSSSGALFSSANAKSKPHGKLVHRKPENLTSTLALGFSVSFTNTLHNLLFFLFCPPDAPTKRTQVAFKLLRSTSTNCTYSQ